MAKRTCSVDGCEEFCKGQGWCGKHYLQFREQDPCSVEDCARPRLAKGWCKKHYYALRPQRSRPCIFEGCDFRTVARGMCATHRKQSLGSAEYTCPECGTVKRGPKGRVYCSRPCMQLAATGAVVRAVRAGHPEGIIAAALASSEVTGSGCWEWQFAKNPNGYAVIGQGAKYGSVHRTVMEAVTGQPLGKLTVHHKCANRGCVNPDHLQVITQRENTAEMFERNYYIRRIAELELLVAQLTSGAAV